MSTLRTTPATARTDVRPEPAPGVVVTPARPTDRFLRWLGAGLATGAVTYGVAFIVSGSSDAAADRFTIDLTGLVFQLGVFCLLAAMWRTAALGTSTIARTMLAVEGVVLGVATFQSVATLPALGGEWGTVATVLDASWPLSMLGMAIVGVKLAVAGRWRGCLRVWPAVAESWFPVVMAASIAFSPLVADWVAGLHFVLGYGVLGLLLALRPQLTRR